MALSVILLITSSALFFVYELYWTSQICFNYIFGVSLIVNCVGFLIAGKRLISILSIDLSFSPAKKVFYRKVLLPPLQPLPHFHPHPPLLKPKRRHLR